MRERTQAVAFVAVWLASLGTILAVLAAVVPSPPARTAEASLTMTIEGPGWTIEYGASTTNGTVFLFLQEASVVLAFDFEYVEYGWPYDDVFITSINGTRSGEVGGHDWQYCVNGRYATLGALRQELHDGDALLWVYAPMGGSELCR